MARTGDLLAVQRAPAVQSTSLPTPRRPSPGTRLASELRPQGQQPFQELGSSARHQSPGKPKDLGGVAVWTRPALSSAGLHAVAEPERRRPTEEDRDTGPRPWLLSPRPESRVIPTLTWGAPPTVGFRARTRTRWIGLPASL